MPDYAVIFALVSLRIAGMLFFAPLLGGPIIPARMKLMLAGVLALGMLASLPGKIELPAEPWQLALGLAGELLLGAVFGLAISLVFVAAQMAGDVAGRQMGFNLAGSFDPSTGMGANPIADLYYILAAFVFLVIDGHHSLVLALGASFEHLPLLAFAMDAEVLHVLVAMLAGTTQLALRLALPVCVAVLVVDLALAMIGRTIPQLGFMSIGVTVRMAAGLVIVLLGLGVAATVLTGSIADAFALAESLWLPR